MAPIWDRIEDRTDRIERKLDRLATVFYIVLGMAVLVWTSANLIFPIVTMWLFAASPATS